MTRALFGGAAALLLGVAVLGMISPLLFGLLQGTGLRLGLWQNAILLVVGTIAAFAASRGR